MALEALLLSRDDEVIRVLRRVLQDLGIGVHVCTGSVDAEHQLAQHKFDAVVIDCDDVHGAVGVLQGLRKTPSNKTSMVFAIINGITSVQAAFQMGAHLALDKPISADAAKHSLRAAQGLIETERRRYYRHPVEMPVWLRFAKEERHATANNLSSGGMAVKVKSALPAGGQQATVTFMLPGTRNWIEAKASIAWADGEGGAGIRFDQMAYTTRETMEKWFTEKLHPKEQAPARGKRGRK